MGATLIYITTGKHPAELPQENLQIQFESFANLSPDLGNWLKWMTDPDLKKRLSSAEQALQTLDEPTAQPRGFGKTVEAIAKPDDSKVVLRCQPESLEIIATYTLPESANAFIYFGIVLCFFGAGPLFLGLMTVLGGLTTLLSALTTLDVSNILSGLLFLMFGVILVATAAVLMLPMLFCIPRQRRLYINASQVALTRKVLFLSHTIRANRREIKQLVCKLRPQQVMLFACQQRFVIPTSSAPELEWLGQELSLWLKIPVDKL